MTMKTKIAATCAAAAMMVTMGAANAQMNGTTPMTGAPMTAPPGTMSGDEMAPGGAMTTTRTTQQTSMSGDDYGADPYAADSGTLPNTGGEPLLMMMAGTLLAGSAFALRRKLS